MKKVSNFKIISTIDSDDLTLEEQKNIFGFEIGYSKDSTKTIGIITKVDKKNKIITIRTK